MSPEPTAVHTITAAELREWQTQHEDVTIIDVRGPAEFANQHIHGSYNVPLPLLAEHTSELADRLGHRTVVVCQSGHRAGQAQQHLTAAGAASATVLAGGVPAYASAGGRVVSTSARWSIERQVRFVAGALVFVSLMLAEFFWPGARFVAVAIGAGLVFAALTNSCMMGQALARMPWNTRAVEPSPDSMIQAVPAATSAR